MFGWAADGAGWGDVVSVRRRPKVRPALVRPGPLGPNMGASDAAGGARRPSHLVARDGDERVARFGIEGMSARDFYAHAHAVSWRRFMAAAGLIYFIINLCFGLLYWLQAGGISNARPGSFSDAFFFSVQTIATIGYGVMSPATFYTNVVMTFETLVGMTMLSIVTGLVFARFSRPVAHVLFSRNAVVTSRNGRPTLQLRMANQRDSNILQAKVEVTLVRNEVTQEGEFMRRFYTLPLERSASPVFLLSFSVMHVIDEASPLFGATEASLREEDAEIVVSLTGIEETMSQTVHARTSYEAAEILWGRRFVDVLGYLPDGRRAVDFSRFHETVEIPA